MRISNRSGAERLLQQLAMSQGRLAEVQHQVTSGLKLNRPSDDPFGSSRVIEARTRLDLGAQYERNILSAEIDLGAAESALDSLNSVLQRANELAVQAANSTVDASSRSQIAEEVDRLIEEALALGNTTHAGRYIFAGFQTNTVPFVPDAPAAPTTVTYAGDAGAIEREIARGERVRVNVDGDAVFSGTLQSLIAFRDHLRANDVVALQGDANAITSDIDRALEARGGIGARMRRLEMAESRRQDDQLQLRQMIAQIQEADFIESVAELQMRESGMQAALATVGRTLGSTLLDFLR